MDNSQYIVILSLIGLVISILVLWQRMGNQKLSRQIETSLLNAASIPSLRNSIGHLNKELSRARRSQSPLSLIVIEHRPTKALFNNMHQGDSSDLPRIVNRRKEADVTDFLLCGKVIREVLRDIDITSYTAENYQFIIVLPESTKLEAKRALKRIKNIIGLGAGQFLTAVSQFPDDGLILDDLIAHAVSSINKKNKNVDKEKNKDKGTEIDIDLEDTITEW